MKKQFLFIVFIATAFAFNCVYAQNNDILTAPVGIGISSPGADLHIHSAVLHEYPSGPQSGNRDGVYNGYFLTTLRMTNTFTGTGNNDGFKIQLTDNEAVLQQKESGFLKVLARNNSGIVIDSVGRVGIGTTPVANKVLTINGNVGFTELANIIGDIQFVNNVKFLDSTSFVGSIRVGNRLHTNKLIATGSATIGNGFICSQNGQVKAKEIVVTLEGWSDYVFDNGYQLMPLGELERYVNTNKHLPNIPSAKEVENNGVNIGEMNALLLEKIEELTLYIIDLQKQIDELKK